MPEVRIKINVLLYFSPTNRPFPSSPQPQFESKAKCKVLYENQFSFILKFELPVITITKISHLDLL